MNNLATPILLIGHVRHELILRRILEMNCQDRVPEIVYLSIDGPRNHEETLIIGKIHDSIVKLRGDLKYELVVNYNTSNLGVDSHIKSQVTRVLEDHNQLIVIEDDVACSTQLNSSMLRGLEILNLNSEKYMFVLGFSPSTPLNRLIGSTLDVSNRNYWRESKYFSAWGWATTRDVWLKFTPDRSLETIEKKLSFSPSWQELSKHKQSIWLERFIRVNYDYQLQCLLFENNKKTLVPSLRLIDNEGFDEKATHTRVRPKVLGPKGILSASPRKLRIFPWPRQKFLDFLDSSMWAGDTWLNVRGRKSGVRSRIRGVLTEREK